MSKNKISNKSSILIKGARLHNLKNIDVEILRNKLVVITGLSGSGKSSLAFDTLYAEGQRRYVESLSSYARQFLGRLNKPEVDHIHGIAPAIAIEQKVNTRNPRSTVGTSTEIYEYLKLLFARLGKTYHPESGEEVKRHDVKDVIKTFKSFEEGERVMIAAPIQPGHNRSLKEELQVLQQIGFSRVWVDQKEVMGIDEWLENEPGKSVSLIIDRLKVKDDEEIIARLADSIETAFFEGKGTAFLIRLKPEEVLEFSNKFELDGQSFEEPTLHLFTFNNPVGACPKCEGYGSVIGIDENLVIPNSNLSLYDDAIVPWRGEKMSEWKKPWLHHGADHGFPIHKPFFELTETEKNMLWEGVDGIPGLNAFFEYVESKSYKIQYRVMLSRYRGKTKCKVCKGTRLKPEANYVKVHGYSITDMVEVSVSKLRGIFDDIPFTDHEKQTGKRILIEIKNRLKFLEDVGLGYLNLNRQSATLSGGESQRINLATSLGSSLVGSMYILDEPSIGLHPRDTHNLMQVLKQLRDLGNTVIVVEHEEEVIRHADQVIDIGPEAGQHGGEVVFSGNIEELLTSGESLTSKYLNGEMSISGIEPRKPKGKISLTGARAHNLKNIDVEIPLNQFTVVTGVSGSGKSSLIRSTLYPAIRRHFDDYAERPEPFKALTGDLDKIDGVEFVDQNPIGRSSRSNPVTYIKAYDEIRNLYASEALSKLRGYKPKHFSFNVEGGRCPVCEGEGSVTIEMQFMADVHLPCEECNGKRFKEEVLEVEFSGKSIYEVLEMTVSQAIEFFLASNQNKIAEKLQPLEDVGLGYIHLGQASSTLSGGEAQRVKLAAFLGNGRQKFSPTLFIFDEPTTGLHFHDINKLLKSFEALLQQGHSILVIEHNLDVIRNAHYVLDLGPEGGEAGGYLVAKGTPEELIEAPSSYTGQFLKEEWKLKGQLQ